MLTTYEITHGWCKNLHRIWGFHKRRNMGIASLLGRHCMCMDCISAWKMDANHLLTSVLDFNCINDLGFALCFLHAIAFKF